MCLDTRCIYIYKCIISALKRIWCIEKMALTLSSAILLGMRWLLYSQHCHDGIQGFFPRVSSLWCGLVWFVGTASGGGHGCSLGYLFVVVVAAYSTPSVFCKLL
jgi:hypothetical protein